MGWGVKNDMSGQSMDALRVYNVKIRQFLLGPLVSSNLNFIHVIDADCKSSFCEHILANN